MNPHAPQTAELLFNWLALVERQIPHSGLNLIFFGKDFTRGKAQPSKEG